MIKTRKYIWKDRVQSCIELGFGDTWAMTSYLMRMSEELGKPIRVHQSNNIEFKNRVQSIVPYLNSTGQINFVMQSPQKGITYCTPYSVKFVPTKKQWQPNSDIVAYQFDGKHLNNKKGLRPGAFRYLINYLKSLGLTPVDVGHRKPLSFIIDTLAQCRFFIGCPSGLSVVSMSVGNPIYLITRNLDPQYVQFLKNCHYQTRPDVQMFTSVKDFLQPRKICKLL